MTTPTVTELVRNGNHVGKRVELARYTIPAGERVLHGQRVNGVVRVTDNPASGRARAYLVERELEQDGNAAHNPSIDLQVGRGHGLHLQINRQPVPDTYGAIVMAELAHLCEFPAVRVEVRYSCKRRPEPAAMARMIADELGRNEIW